jgi:hypothetical protein
MDNYINIYPIFSLPYPDSYDLAYRSLKNEIQIRQVIKIRSNYISVDKLKRSLTIDEKGNPYTKSKLKTKYTGKFIPFLSEIIPIFEIFFSKNPTNLEKGRGYFNKAGLYWYGCKTDFTNFYANKRNSLSEEGAIINFQTLKSLRQGNLYQISPLVIIHNNEEAKAEEEQQKNEEENNLSLLYDDEKSIDEFLEENFNDQAPAQPIQLNLANEELINYWENMSQFSNISEEN